MGPRVTLCLSLALAGCFDASVIEVDAGSYAADRGAPEDRGAAEDRGGDAGAKGLDADLPDVSAPADIPGDTPGDRGPPRDLGPPRTLGCGPLARQDDPNGDTVVVGNEAGGQFTLVLDVPVANVGVIARGPVDLALAGDYVRSVRVVHIVGEGSAASTLYAPREVRFERGGTPAATTTDASGAATMACASDCQAGGNPVERGCNTAAQIRDYFQRRFGEGRRMLHLQTSTFDGLYVFAGRGGCCLP